MRQPTQIAILLALSVLIFFACKKDTSTPHLHTDYFDMTEGRYIVYNATEINHDDDAGVHDTSTFLLKTIIGSNYIDNEGRVGKEYLRLKSFDGGLTWQNSDVWTQFRSNSKAEMVEENQKIIKLVFAPSYDKEWDIHAFNANAPLIAFYSSIHNPLTINGLSFDSTVTVVQEDFFSLVDLRRKSEVYAKHVGLVSKSFKNLIIENFDTLQPKKGTEIFYEVIEFGME